MGRLKEISRSIQTAGVVSQIVLEAMVGNLKEWRERQRRYRQEMKVLQEIGAEGLLREEMVRLREYRPEARLWRRPRDGFGPQLNLLASRWLEDKREVFSRVGVLVDLEQNFLEVWGERIRRLPLNTDRETLTAAIQEGRLHPGYGYIEKREFHNPTLAGRPDKYYQGEIARV